MVWDDLGNIREGELHPMQVIHSKFRPSVPRLCQHFVVCDHWREGGGRPCSGDGGEGARGEWGRWGEGGVISGTGSSANRMEIMGTVGEINCVGRKAIYFFGRIGIGPSFAAKAVADLADGELPCVERGTRVEQQAVKGEWGGQWSGWRGGG